MDRRLLDYIPEMELDAIGAAAADLPGAARTVFGEAEEMAQSTGLLEARDPAALVAFIDTLIDRVGGRLGRSGLRATPLGAALGRGLQAALRPILPLHADAGGADALKRRAAHVFGLELEGLSPEDKEFETARQALRFAADIVARAVRLPGGDAARRVATAVRQAARRHAPGLLRPLAPGVASAAPQSPNQPIFSPTREEYIMHDIDRTTLEYGQEMSGYEGEQFEFGQGEWSGGGQPGVFSEAEEMELANDLLSVGNEAELEQFLGDFLKKAASVAGKVIKSPVGQAIGGVLKGVAKKALPLAGGALGGFFGGPLGAQIGSGLASAAGGALGLEAETSNEEMEFEGARQFVRLAADAVNRAASAHPNADPRAVAQAAATAAARQFAPGLLGKAGANGGALQPARQGNGGAMAAQAGGMGGPGASGARSSGRWTRQGRRIVLHGV